MATSRAFNEGRQLQGEDEQIVYDLTVWDTATSPSVVVKDVTNNYADVTTTVMPTGSASANGAVITLPLLKSLTAGHLYRIEVKFTISGNVFERYGEIQAEM